MKILRFIAIDRIKIRVFLRGNLRNTFFKLFYKNEFRRGTVLTKVLEFPPCLFGIFMILDCCRYVRRIKSLLLKYLRAVFNRLSKIVARLL